MISSYRVNGNLPIIQYLRAQAASPEDAIRTIIRHWSIITGREMKARRVTPS